MATLGRRQSLGCEPDRGMLTHFGESQTMVAWTECVGVTDSWPPMGWVGRGRERVLAEVTRGLEHVRHNVNRPSAPLSGSANNTLNRLL